MEHWSKQTFGTDDKGRKILDGCGVKGSLENKILQKKKKGGANHINCC